MRAAIYPVGSTQTLASWVGLVPSQFNFVNGQNFALTAASTNPPAGWSKDGGVTTPSSITTGQLAPDGTTTASKLVEGFDNAGLGQSSIHSVTAPDRATGASIGQGFAELDGFTMRFQVIAKAVERTRIVLFVDNGAGAFGSGNFASAGFDLAGGNTSYDNSVTNFTIVSTTMVKLFGGGSGGGWWLCTMDYNTGANSTVAFRARIAVDNGSGTAARSITYAGNGTSGVLLWYAVLLPLCAFTQFSHETFRDDFTSLSTIDMNNSRSAGFNWYLQTSWPNTTQGGCWQLGFPTPASTVSQSGSVMTLARDNSTANNTGNGGGCANTLASAAPRSDNASIIVGKQFLYPAIVEASFAVTNLGAGSFGGTKPAFWCFTAGVHKGPSGAGGDNFGYENDFTDVYNPQGTGTFQVNTTQSPSLVPPVGITFENAVITGIGSTGITDFRQHGYMLVRPDSTTGNKGVAMSFLKVPTSTSALTSMFIPSSTSKQWDNTVGAPSGGGLYYTDPFYILLGAGWGPFDPGTGSVNTPVPTAWDYVRVIQ